MDKTVVPIQVPGTGRENGIHCLINRNFSIIGGRIDMPALQISPNLRGHQNPHATRPWRILLAALVFVAATASAQLTTINDQLFKQDPWIGGSPFHEDWFGSALATGDFDGNGHPDLAIGAKFQDRGAFNSGLVYTLYSTTQGLRPLYYDNWYQGVQGIKGTPENGDHFGTALAAGDFDGDGVDDLAIGVPRDKVGAAGSAGAVNVIYGLPSIGLSTLWDQLLHQDSPGLKGVAESGDEFGTALAAADFNGDGYDDLAVGASGDDDGGAVNVIYGTGAGLDPLWKDEMFRLEDVTSNGFRADLFGAALTTGFFNNDSYADLAIGIPDSIVGGKDNAGAVAVIYGSALGLGRSAPSQYWHQNTPGVRGRAKEDEKFGYSLAAGDFDGDQLDDLAIGVPFEIYGTQKNGAVHVLFGATFGLDAKGDALLTVAGNNLLGWALTAGDFNGDGYDDLVAGELLGDSPTANNCGAARIFEGGFTGRGPGIHSTGIAWTQDSGLQGVPELLDHFGRALTAADFDQNGSDDLVIGAPWESLGAWKQQGVVHVIRSQ